MRTWIRLLCSLLCFLGHICCSMLEDRGCSADVQNSNSGITFKTHALLQQRFHHKEATPEAGHREELESMKNSQLKKLARSLGASEEDLDEADDAPDLKAALIEHISQLEEKVQIASQPELIDCPLPDGVIWCEVRLKNLPAFWMASRQWGQFEKLGQDDHLSWKICTDGFWEEDDMSQFGAPGHLLDIGANMGYFALAFAQAGWTVSAFEPMADNVALLSSSLCRNPHLASRIKIYPFGLSTQPNHCSMIAPVRNTGDGYTRCVHDMADQEVPPDFKHKGEFEVRRLDAALSEGNINHVDAVKVDVEGYEFQVFAGGGDFLSQLRPRFIRTEVWNEMNGASGEDYLKMIAAAGYSFFSDGRCSTPIEDVYDGVKHSGTLDLYACRQQGL